MSLLQSLKYFNSGTVVIKRAKEANAREYCLPRRHRDSFRDNSRVPRFTKGATRSLFYRSTGSLESLTIWNRNSLPVTCLDFKHEGKGFNRFQNTEN